MAVIQEAYIHGVSAHAVNDVVRAMGLTGTPKSQVSRLKQVDASSYTTSGDTTLACW